MRGLVMGFVPGLACWVVLIAGCKVLVQGLHPSWIVLGLAGAAVLAGAFALMATPSENRAQSAAPEVTA